MATAEGGERWQWQLGDNLKQYVFGCIFMIWVTNEITQGGVVWRKYRYWVRPKIAQWENTNFPHDINHPSRKANGPQSS